MTDSSRSRFRLPHWGWFLLATVVLVVVWIGLSIWLPYHREQHIIEAIESWPGSDFYAGRLAPQWLEQVLGESRMSRLKVFYRVINIELKGTTITDAEIGYLNRLTNLEFITLTDTAVTDAGLVHLRKLTNLRFLVLSKTAVTDAGLIHLRGLTNADDIFLENTAVTDDGIASLEKSLPNCSFRH
jgi:hypothetical protein